MHYIRAKKSINLIRPSEWNFRIKNDVPYIKLLTFHWKDSLEQRGVFILKVGDLIQVLLFFSKITSQKNLSHIKKIDNWKVGDSGGKFILHKLTLDKSP